MTSWRVSRSTSPRIEASKAPSVAIDDFGDVEISEAENSGLNSWENFREKFLSFLDTIPNHVQIKLDTGFFQGQAPETEEMFRNEMAEFGNNLQVLAADEPQVIEEWNKISDENDSNFQSLL